MRHRSPNIELRVARVRASLSQERLASLVSSYQKRISLIETGHSQPTNYEIERLVAVLNVPREVLFPDCDGVEA